MNKCIISIIILISLLISPSLFPDKKKLEYYNVEDAYHWTNDTIKFNEKLHKKYNPKSGIYLPLLETLSVNLIIGSYNRYVTKSHFAKISFTSIKNNLKHGLDLDADDLYTNFWRHPFQGSIYFNTARTNGYNYYESLLVALFGSLQWEFFMETEPAAKNDIILTTFAGAMLGEAFYRLSNYILDESSSGFERFLREGGTAFLNPGRFINRGIRGRYTRSLNKDIYLKRKYFFNFKVGMSNMNKFGEYSGNKPRLYLKYTINYNDPFLKKRVKPFDYFHIKSEINPAETNVQESLLSIKTTNLFGTFRIFSTLYGRKYQVERKNKKLEVILGIFQNFDYLQNDIYQIGSLDLSFGLLFKRKSKSDTLLLGGLTFGIVPMSGVDSPYAKYFMVESLNQSRDYNLSRGVTSNMYLEFHIPYITFKLLTTYWYLRTYHGAPGYELIGILEPSIHINLLKRISIGLESTIYHRKAFHKDFPDLDETNRNYKIFIEFKI